MKTKKVILVILSVFFYSNLFATASPKKELCRSEYFQACKQCKELNRVTTKAEPNDGDYYRGAQWNGLYTAYVHNCLDVAENLLRRGADPNWGGWQGSMILSAVDAWPHNDRSVNEKWVALLLKYHADFRKKVPDQTKTPQEMVRDGDFEPDYKDLWKLFEK